MFFFFLFSEETKEQIEQLEQKLKQLEKEKQQLFMQLKKVLNEDEIRKRQQQKETKWVWEMFCSNYKFYIIFYFVFVSNQYL